MAASPPPARAAAESPSRVRHRVLTLTVLLYMITYMDRICISNAAPAIREEFGFDWMTMAWIFSAFSWSYALFQIPGGWMGDRFGPRRVLTVIVIWWSAFTAATALAWNRWSMYASRLLFGLGEAGAFPTATRALSHWLPATERAFAQGITHAGSRLGATITPPIVVFLMMRFGWRSVFWIFGAIGIVWAAVWRLYYRDRPSEHLGVNAAELALIGPSGSGRRRVQVPWRRILARPNMWVICAMYFCYAYTLQMYMTWFPTYLLQARNFSMAQMGLVQTVALAAGTIGDLVGGWLSDWLARRTGNLRWARRSVAITGFLLAAGCILPAALTHDRSLSVALTALGLFGLELTVGVSWAVVMDIGPEFAGSISGVMNMCGNLGSAVSPLVFAKLLVRYGWQAPFVVACGLCLLGAISYLRIDPDDRIVAENAVVPKDVPAG